MSLAELTGADLWSILGPALVAGLMIALTHAPMGVEVLRRQIIFIDLAIAQIAGLGLVAAGIFWPLLPTWGLQLAALASALLAGAFFRLVERRAPELQEPIIGVSFVLAASLAILVLSNQPQGSDEIQHLLSGQLLFVTWGELAWHAPIYALILIAWFWVPKLRTGLGFYVLFALAVTSSVQLIGVYVVFASLILPALAAYRSLRPMLVAWSTGVIAVSGGILASFALDLPSGPLIVLAYVLVAITVFSLSRQTEA